MHQCTAGNYRTRIMFTSNQEWMPSARPTSSAIHPGGTFPPAAWRPPNPSLKNGPLSDACFLAAPVVAPPRDKRGPHIATVFRPPDSQKAGTPTVGVPSRPCESPPENGHQSDDRKPRLGQSTSAPVGQLTWEHSCVFTGCAGAVESSRHRNRHSTDAQRCRRAKATSLAGKLPAITMARNNLAKSTGSIRSPFSNFRRF